MNTGFGGTGCVLTMSRQQGGEGGVSSGFGAAFLACSPLITGETGKRTHGNKEAGGDGKIVEDDGLMAGGCLIPSPKDYKP